MASTPSEEKKFQTASLPAGSANTRKPSECAPATKAAPLPGCCCSAGPKKFISPPTTRTCVASPVSKNCNGEEYPGNRNTEPISAHCNPSEFFLLVMIVTGKPVSSYTCVGVSNCNPEISSSRGIAGAVCEARSSNAGENESNIT